MSAAPTILWFRQDLRIADQAALAAASSAGPCLPVYVLDDDAPGPWRTGAASRWWLHHSLASLDNQLRRLGGRLLLLRGESVQLIKQLAADTGARQVHALRHVEPWARKQQDQLASALDLQLHDGTLLAPIGQVATGSGTPFKVFTPFWRALLEQMPPPPPAPPPDQITLPADAPSGSALADWGLLPTRPDWASGFTPLWQPGTDGAQRRLVDFETGVADYRNARDMCAREATSRLSPHLHFGELSPAQVWHGLMDRPSSGPFLRQLVWRDFSMNLLHHSPDLADVNWKQKFDAFPWPPLDQSRLAAWQRGQTGYPIVDAGMRQLWQTGWMHNRVRMIVASFLIKHLMIDWREGERWFWDTLVDADLANNAAGWQWVAGSGADASPYFRIFNPMTQGEKFDPAGDYVRRWVPELAKLPDQFIHMPWTADQATLSGAGVLLGRTYPNPIVDHKVARETALAAFESLS